MRLLKNLPALILCLLWAAAQCDARQDGPTEPEEPQALRQEREKRLSVNGLVVDSNSQLSAVHPDAGQLLPEPFVVRANTPGEIKGLRLHFTVRRLDEAQRGTWSVSVVASVNGRDQTWVYASRDDPASDDFWTPAMPGSRLSVRVFSVVPHSTLQLVIDQRIEYKDPVRQKTIVGNDDTVEIRRVSNPARREWGRSVALLTFVGATDRKAYTCTGFLVAPDVLITNDHCPRTRTEVAKTLVEFDYDNDFAETDRYRLVWEDADGRRLPRDPDLDFAFYKLNRPVAGRGFLKLRDDDGNLRNSRPLVIIQHPGGRPKRMASFACHVKTQTPVVAPPTDFGHVCDTEGGSSGAPVQDAEGYVIGLHHFGYGNTRTTQINQAVKMGEILKVISRKDRQLYRLLTEP